MSSEASDAKDRILVGIFDFVRLLCARGQRLGRIVADWSGLDSTIEKQPRVAYASPGNVASIEVDCDIYRWRPSSGFIPIFGCLPRSLSWNKRKLQLATSFTSENIGRCQDADPARQHDEVQGTCPVDAGTLICITDSLLELGLGYVAPFLSAANPGYANVVFNSLQWCCCSCCSMEYLGWRYVPP
jgi:hypothetical protein